MPSTRRSFLAALGATSLAASAGCVTVDAPSRDGVWPTAGYTDARTHHTPTDGPTGYLYPSWSAETGEGYPLSTPVVDDATDSVYVLQSNYSAEEPRTASVVAFDAATGEERWQRFLLTEFTDLLDVHFDSLRLHADEGLLYAQTINGIHALNPEKGTLEWVAPLPTTAQPWPGSGAPVVESGTLVAGPYGDRDGRGGELRGYDPATGEERWRHSAPGYDRLWTLSARDGTVYAPFLGREAGGGVLAVDAATGDLVWESQLPVDGPIAVGEDRVVVPLRGGDGDGDESVAGLRRDDWGVEWTNTARRRTDSGFAVADGTVFYVTDGTLLARDLHTGERVWTFGEERKQVYLGWTPVVAGDYVYAVREQVSADDGSEPWLYALGVEDGAIYGSGPLGGGTGRSSLAVVEGAAYLTTSTDGVRCYESCTREAFGRCVLG